MSAAQILRYGIRIASRCRGGGHHFRLPAGQAELRHLRAGLHYLADQDRASPDPTDPLRPDPYPIGTPVTGNTPSARASDPGALT